MKTIAKILLAAGATVALSAPSNAATQSANLGVSANINGACSIQAAALGFGAYAAASPTSATATVTVNCTSALPYSVSLGNGNNYTTTRRMTSGAGNFLAYGLYSDAAHTAPWSTGGQAVAGSGSGADQSLSVYGLIPSGQTGATTGNFNDTVLMTITY